MALKVPVSFEICTLGKFQPRERKKEPATIRLKILSSDEALGSYYRILKKLEEGPNGDTFLVEDSNSTKLTLTVYEKRADWFEGPFAGALLKVYRELLIQTKILPPHPNILAVRDLLVSRRKIFVCRDLCSDVATIEEFYKHASPAASRTVFQQLCQAVRTMHRHGVLHLSLGPGSVLFTDYDFSACKVTNFARAAYNSHLAAAVNDGFDPRAWLLPEELQSPHGEPHDDVRALGRILLCILCGEPVLAAASAAEEAAINRRHAPRADRFDEAALDLLRKIGPRPYGPAEDKDLPRMDTVCHHPWIRKGDVHLSLFNDLNAKLSGQWASLGEMARFMNSGGVPVRVLDHDSEIEAVYRKLGTLKRALDEPTVWEVIDCVSNQRLAMKVVSRRGRSESGPGSRYPERDAFSVLAEVVIMWRVLPRHAHIVELRAVHLSPDLAFLVTAYGGRHTLVDFVGFARNDSAKRVFRQVAETVRFMHQHGVAHMDLKLEHVLLRDLDDCQVEITSFGKSAFVAEMARTAHDGFRGSQWFGAEYMQVAGRYGRAAADVRALGSILHAMICGHPDPGLEYLELFQNQGSTFDDKAFNLLFKIGPSPLGPAEDKNLFSVDQILSHEWLK